MTVLKEAGVTDFDQYHNCPGEPLSPDFFLGDGYPIPESYSEPGTFKLGGDKIASMMAKFQPLMTEDVISKTGIIFAIDFGDRTYVFDLKESGSISQGDGEGADVTFQMSPDIFVKVVKGELQTTAAFMSGQMKIKGNLMEAMKLESLFKKMKSKL
eukprot:sb/3473152/